MIEAIDVKSAPEVKRVILAAFPEYRKQRLYLTVFPEHGVQINSYWDGGSRDYFAIVELASLRRMPMPTATHPYFEVAARGMANQSTQFVESDHVGNITLKMLPEGYALVQSGVFCGKPATAHVYLNSANMAKLLPKGGL